MNRHNNGQIRIQSGGEKHSTGHYNEKRWNSSKTLVLGELWEGLGRVGWCGSWDRKGSEGSLPLLEVLCMQNRCLTSFMISNSFKLPLQWLFVFCLPHLYLFYTEIKKKNNHAITSADWTFKIITFQRNRFFPHWKLANVKLILKEKLGPYHIS